MPVSHVGLTVSHVPSACSFFLSALQPLGYRYVGNQGDSVGFGTDDADFFLSPEVPGVNRSNAHVAFSATSKSAVRDFYAAALTAGGQPNGSPAFRGCNDCIFNAAVLDLDGNSIEVIYHQIEDDDPYTTVSGGSRVLTWRRGIVNVLGDEDRSTFISTSPNPAPSTAQSTPQSKVPSVVRTASAPAVTTSSQNSSSDNGFQITGKAIIGTILGAAAGAAVAYAMVRSEQDGAQQEAEFAQAISRKAASSRASSKAPSKATPSQAQTSKAKTVYNSATMSKAAPASRISEIKESTETRPRTRAHRNYSTTESVIASRVMEQFSDDEPELVLRPRKAHSVRAIEAAPEPQSLEEVDARSYHSPTYVSLAPTPRAAKKSEAIYIPASQIVSRAPSRAPSGPPSIAPTERQIEYIPASLATQRPSIVSRRAVTSPSSICHTDRQIEDVPARTNDWTSQDLVVARRDSAMRVTTARKEKYLLTESVDIPIARANTEIHQSYALPYDGSDVSTIKASRINGSYHSAAGIPLPGSRKSSVVSAADLPLPISRKTSIISAADYALPGSRKTSIVSGADMPLPISRRPSLVSAMERPLPISRAVSTTSGHQIPLPESRSGSIIDSILGRPAPEYEPSAAAVPLPESRKTSLVGSLGLLANDPIPRIDDLETVAPDDSISCVASRHTRHSRDESRHRERSHDHESRKSGSSKKHRNRSLHGEGSSKSSRHAEAESEATVKFEKSSKYSAVSLPLHARNRTGIEKDEKRGQRSFVSVAFGGR
ncbi:hypothetical protein D6C85_02614 [Aureobasidium pullulans]|uniref:VOC domain-containing protein n=1 Tax=Aureobasidium pullulans TaxID=5580 RepID=A0A4S9XAT8_AURPU|nr:hypothetical protein D6C85_02614 [Aureobasidium pullulans]